MLCFSTRCPVAELGDPLQERSRPQPIQPWGCGLRGRCGLTLSAASQGQGLYLIASVWQGPAPSQNHVGRGRMFAVPPGEGGGEIRPPLLGAAGGSVSGRGADHGLRAAGRPGAEPASVGGRLAARDGTRCLWAPGWTGRRWACVLCRESHSLLLCRSLGACVGGACVRSSAPPGRGQQERRSGCASPLCHSLAV